MPRDFATYHQELIDKNPLLQLDDPDIIMRLRNCEYLKQAERNYNRGVADERARQEAARKLAESVMPKNPFGQMFG